MYSYFLFRFNWNFGLWIFRHRFDVGTMLRVFERNLKNPALAQQKNNGFLWRTSLSYDSLTLQRQIQWVWYDRMFLLVVLSTNKAIKRAEVTLYDLKKIVYTFNHLLPYFTIYYHIYMCKRWQMCFDALMKKY